MNDCKCQDTYVIEIAQTAIYRSDPNKIGFAILAVIDDEFQIHETVGRHIDSMTLHVIPLRAPRLVDACYDYINFVTTHDGLVPPEIDNHLENLFDHEEKIAKSFRKRTLH
jgi:hypothetical protein